MDVTSESLREKFRMLNDAELLDLFQSGDLTDIARGVALAELRQRGIDPKKPKEVPAPQDIPTDATQDELDPELWAGSSGDLVLVGRFLTPAEAYMVQSRLAVEGVPALVADTLATQNIPWGSGLLGGVRVLVPESHVDRARRILQAVERGDYALRDQPDGHSA
jgi:hypothetical protein